MSLKLAAARWSRPATDGTKAVFTLVDGEKGNRIVKDIKLDGPGLHVRGSVEVSKTGDLRAAKLTEIRLEEDDVFAVSLVPDEQSMNLTVSGTTFDARPYIKNLITPAKTDEAAGDQPQGQNFNVTADFESVTAHRGEVIRG